MMFPILFCLLLLPAAASAADFATPQYEDLQEYVYEDLSELQDPVSDDRRDALYAGLEVYSTRAYWSVEVVLATTIKEIESNFRYNSREAEIRAERKIQAGIQRAGDWYRKNKSKPGAKKEFQRRVAAVNARVQNELAKDLVFLEDKYIADETRTYLQYELQAERINSITNTGIYFIDKLPALVQ